ncbi:MAG TPA: hypothetical protein VEI53_03145 [Ktedonobacteraceae bacterium]|jgi:hypothetical protein|nr:hypothetical protein [Ktedonobacteraceae bacterium]
MISQEKRQFGPRFGRGNWSDPRVQRGYRQHAFFHAHQGHHRQAKQWRQPTSEQLALRSSAMEVAQLFAIAARKSYGDAEKQSQLRAFLDRSHQELSDFIYGTNQDPK